VAGASAQEKGETGKYDPPNLCGDVHRLFFRTSLTCVRSQSPLATLGRPQSSSEGIINDVAVYWTQLWNYIA
jgi:hypothetical protein